MDKCLFGCSLKSGKFDLINWRTGWVGEANFTYTQQKIFLLFFSSLISFKNKVVFFSETEKTQLSLLSLRENNIS